MKLTYKHTRIACYATFFSQAAVNMLAPLLFVTFQTQFGLSLEQVGRLILINFGTQLITDLLAMKLVERTGYRLGCILGNLLGGAGLIGLTVFPNLLADAYTGLCLAALLYGMGAGFMEVVISPVIAYLPGDDSQTGAIAFLNAAYSWGQVVVVAFSTLFLYGIGTQHWQILPVVWSAFPFLVMILFFQVPIVEPQQEKEQKMMNLRELASIPLFLLALLLMVCTGAAVISMSQWSSFFAEQGLGIPKVMGDLLGPCLFCGFAGTGRILFGLYGKNLNIPKTLMGSSVLCVICYLTAVFSPWPLLSLAGCALCGAVTCLMWPGTVSMCAVRFPLGGIIMFGLLAVFGDIGCSLGPWLTGLISDTAANMPEVIAYAAKRGQTLDQAALKIGLMAAMIFPIIQFIGLYIFRQDQKKQENK